MMQRIAAARRVFKDQGFFGVLYVVLLKLHVQVGNRWLIDRLVRKHNPYTGEVWETLECPHCRSRLERTDEGLLCRQCQDVYV